MDRLRLSFAVLSLLLVVGGSGCLVRGTEPRTVVVRGHHDNGRHVGQTEEHHEQNGHGHGHDH